MERASRTHRVTSLALTVMLAVFFIWPVDSAAAATAFSVENIGGSVGLGTADLKETILNVIRWLLGVLTLIAVGLIIYGGFLWITAAGNAQRIEKAKRVILNAVIGLVIVLISWAIVFFVARTASDLAGGGGGGPTITLPPGGGSNDFVVERITTDCGDPASEFTNDVYRCSAVNLVFNHLVDDATVQSAVAAGTLQIKQCVDSNGNDLCEDTEFTIPTPPDGRAVDGQVYQANAPTGTKPEWVAKAGKGGKTVTFFHLHALFDADRQFRVYLPKSIKDSDGRTLKACTPSYLLSGCAANLAGDGYEWTMAVGTSVDTIPPRIAATYPASEYAATCSVAAPKICRSGAKAGLGCFSDADCQSGAPDQDVNRNATLTVTFDQPIAPIIKQNDLGNPLNNTVAVLPMTGDPDPVTGLGGTTGTPLVPWDNCDPALPGDFCVQLAGDGRTLQIALRSGELFDAFTWYKVQVRDIKDLCNNTQDPNPFAEPPMQWVFETNNVVPGVADHYPRNGTTNACADTPIFIRYTTSMYDILNNTCRVPAVPGTGGFVDGATMAPGPAVGTKFFDVDAADDYVCGAVCPNPNDVCKLYSFTPTTSLLPVGVNQSMNVDSRYVTNDSGGTLDFSWSFGVAPAGSCVNAPVIKLIKPPLGTDDQCLSVLGENFDPAVPGRNGGDDLLFDGASTPSSAWNNTAIVTRAPGGLALGNHEVKVRAEFPAPFGTLESNGYPWKKVAGPASTSACLISLNPDRGYPGTTVEANGERFEPPLNTVRKVHFGPVEQPWSSWTDTKVITSAPTLAPLPMTVNVSIENSGGDSNPLPFTIDPVPPDQPYVSDKWPGCGTACVDAAVAAEFTIDLDPATVTSANVILRQCTDPDCTTFSATVTGPVSYAPASRRVSFTPAGGLSADTSYRAILRDGIKATTGGSLGGLNYADGGPTTNAFSWVFRTRPGAGGCVLDRVAIDPSAALISTPAGRQNFTATGFSEPDSCSATGQPIDPLTLDWTVDAWDASVPAGKASITSTTNAWTAEATAIDQTPPGPPVNVKKSVRQGPIVETGSGALTIDFTFCDETTDCTRGGFCPGSTCDIAASRCRPILKSISPSDGAIGTWVGINGCYFGSYVPGKCAVPGADIGEACSSGATCDSGACDFTNASAVIYGGNKVGLWPDAAICGSPGSLWRDEAITSEVPNRSTLPNNDDGLGDPNDATDGPVVVQRWDGERTPAGPSFDVNTAETPGICSIVPGAGPEGVDVRLRGQNFGGVRGASTVTFYKEIDAVTYDSWSDTEVLCKAPAGITNNVDNAYIGPSGGPWNRQEVALRNASSSRWSNIVNFDVLSAPCSVCSDDGDCGAQSCGYPSGGYRCCATKPAVTGRNPSGTGICRNSVMTATFDRDMDGGTIGGGSVTVFDGSGTAIGVRVGYDGPSRTVRIEPIGLLPRNTTVTVKLSDGGIIRSAQGAKLDPYQWSFTTADLATACEVARVDISPSSWTFANSGAASQQTFTAEAKASDGTTVFRVPGLYDWEWAWRLEPAAAVPTDYADFSAPPGDSPVAAIRAKPKQGIIFAIAEAKPRASPPPNGLNTTVAGASTLRITACEQAWYFKDSLAGPISPVPPGCTDARAGCGFYNFEMTYCRDGGLPDLSFDSGSGTYRPSILGATGGSDRLLKEFLFLKPGGSARDAIGMRIYDNVDGLSAREWYRRHVPNPGSPSSLIVDGYDAVRDGTTVYVGATNRLGGTFYKHVYLISYNEDAGSDVVSIYNQLLESMTFNIDLSGVCRLSPFEADKPCLQRDLKRIAALADIVQYLREQKTRTGSYSNIESGSYLPQLSFSTWPSWQQRLGADLDRTLSVDPVNVINNCAASMCVGGADAGKACTGNSECASNKCRPFTQDGTCWNELEKSFICRNTATSTSHILGYKYVPESGGDPERALLYANLEYKGPGTWIPSPVPSELTGVCPSSPSPSSCQCFNYVYEP